MIEPKTLWQLPILKGVAGGAVFFIVASVLVTFILPAWAVEFPIGGYVINLGDAAPWIAIAVSLGIWLDARQAKKKAAEAAALAGGAVKEIAAVAVQIDGLLKDRDKANVAEGAAMGAQRGVEAAQQLAEGQRQGIEMERASAAAKAETGVSASADAAIQAATAAAAAAAIAAPAAAAIAAPPAAAIAAPPAADLAAPPVVKAVVPPVVEEAVKAAFERERLKEKK